MSTITRQHTNQRMSQIVTHGDTVYLAGQVGDENESVTDQAHTALSRVDALLKEAGSSREHLLQVTIWLADMADFEAMNEVWDAWVPEGHAPARACGEAKLADSRLLVEFLVSAAKA
ncbi:RidA family protein [Pseudomonas syringae Cit 7]|uniref:RidA family protein n=1 Tax=Pseudomonas syringae Cit 7 TaxID=629264 RepID=A0A8T8LV01_PSESX|nr:RidA family protein [Pseudomonas syringae]PBP68880.1 RidA/YER057c/UK114 family protein [Pseudomonas syringae]QUP65309.1 RidA family protein [Pseudomonas syringae Cit 7]SDT21055.1 Enamine deaminase RidA, house cleaning of reactive enamine intermediates, YjgF/YER057c/UK114 family [Pseudomonas syringae]